MLFMHIRILAFKDLTSVIIYVAIYGIEKLKDVVHAKKEINMLILAERCLYAS